MTLPPSPSFRLDTKRALVTGASSGIGLASAVALARAGAEVTLAARRLDVLEGVANALADEGYVAHALQMDISNVEETARSIAANGPFDVLVNSAGRALHSRAESTRPEDFDDVMNVNLRGAFFVTGAVAKGLLSAGKPGSLINISSQMGQIGGPDRAVYCASKFAIEGFTKAMAIDWGSAGIRVNTICPTFIRTPLTEPTFQRPEMVEWITSKIKLARAGTTGDITGAVLYLASEASALVTGTSLLIDGGWTAG